jgi:hypothetical protein
LIQENVMPLATAEVLDQIASQLRLPEDPDHNKFRTFKTMGEARDYIGRELIFWQPITGAAQIANNYRQLLNLLDRAAAQDFGPNINQAITQPLLRLQQPRYGFISSDSPLAAFLAQLEKKSPEMVRAAISYYDGTWNQSAGNLARSKDFLEGVIAYIAFKHNAFDAGSDARLQALDRQISEVTSLRDALKQSHETLQNDAATWKGETQEARAEAEGAIAKTLDDSRASIASVAEEGHKLFSDTNITWNTALEQFHDAARNKMAAIEQAYDEQMRLKKPADYWSGLEETYKHSGGLWAGVTTIAVLVLVSVGLGVAYNPPSVFNDTKVSLSGIKGAVLIGAAISMMIYLINLYVRLCISSFHLARDARERYQLTYVFLALIKDQAIQPEDRQLILSSLFSRADTGLLKGDAGPTIPTPLGTLFDAMKPGTK